MTTASDLITTRRDFHKPRGATARATATPETRRAARLYIAALGRLRLEARRRERSDRAEPGRGPDRQEGPRWPSAAAQQQELAAEHRLIAAILAQHSRPRPPSGDAAWADRWEPVAVTAHGRTFVVGADRDGLYLYVVDPADPLAV